MLSLLFLKENKLSGKYYKGTKTAPLLKKKFRKADSDMQNDKINNRNSNSFK